MDVYEANRIVMSRIQSLDPENASRIMGLILIQENGEKEMIRLAFGPESLVHSVVLQARKELGLASNSPSTNSTPSPSSPSPFLSRQSSSASSRLLGGVNRLPSLTIPDSSVQAAWGAFADLQHPGELISSGTYNPSANNGVSGDGPEEFQIQDQLPLLNCSGETLPFSAAYSGGANWDGTAHRRSCSVTDACLSMDEAAGFGWKSCHYYAKGYCKNGSSCRYVHDGVGDVAAMVNLDYSGLGGSTGTPEVVEQQCHELLRSKSAHQQRLAAASQLMASGSFPYSPKYINYLLQQQQIDSPRGAAAMMISDDLLKFNRARLDRNDFSVSGGTGNGNGNASSRQIYLTFPADSTFREGDVSNYFSLYGPVEDVRIPYQEKRMYGFVTFVYPETVKFILAKGNPHFVCDARILVKPYKEKGKVPDKKHQHFQRAEFSPCVIPTGMDPRDPFDLQLRGMYCGSPDSLWRKKLEEHADLQQALELQSRRLMGLQLLDAKRQHHSTLSTGSPIPSSIHSPKPFNQPLILPSFHSNSEGSPLVKCSSPSPIGPTTSACRVNCNGFQEIGVSKEIPTCNTTEDDLQECLEHNLPVSPFSPPAKETQEYSNVVMNGEEEELNNDSLLPAASSVDAASFKSYNCQLPGLASGHGAIGMYTGTEGPTCHVGM